jgi:DNA segregation ATPase FtsK/SpoIIIE-like protein
VVGAGRVERGWPELASGTLAAAWLCRVELALLVVPVIAWWLPAGVVGELAAGALVAASAVGALVFPAARRRLLVWLYVARARRTWARAATDVGLSAGPWRAPRVLVASRVPAGDLLRVRVLRGQSAVMLDARAVELAACLRARAVRVEREPGDAAIARVTVVRRDPFEDTQPLAWPAADTDESSLWESVPIGLDEQGEPVQIGLVERNVLVGGEPGAGKSVALSLLVAAGALDRDARVWLLDGKLVELAVWAPVAERLVGPDGEQAIAVLRDVQRVMEERYRELLARGLRKVRREDELPLHLVVVDELAFYLSLPDRKQRQQFAELLRDLVARGRAAGVIVVAATQKPGADVVPTAMRDLFGFRLALRCNTPQASDTILGQGWASAGADASTIPGGQRGVGYLLAEGERPERVKGYHLDDEQIAAIAERAAARRADAWLTSSAAIQSGSES